MCLFDHALTPPVDKPFSSLCDVVCAGIEVGRSDQMMNLQVLPGGRRVRTRYTPKRTWTSFISARRTRSTHGQIYSVVCRSLKEVRIKQLEERGRGKYNFSLILWCTSGSCSSCSSAAPRDAARFLFFRLACLLVLTVSFH